MRIGIDCTPLGSTPRSGIGSYTFELLRRVVATDHDFVLYGCDEADAALLPARPGRITLQQRGAMLPRLVQSVLVSGYGALADRLDVFWSPTHRLPPWLPRHVAGVMTVHDFVWKRYPETMQGRNLLIERLFMSRSLQLARRLICVSDFTRSELQGLYPEHGHKAEVIPLSSRFPMTSPAAAGPDRIALPERYVLFVGTSEPRKNLAGLLAAYAQVPPGLRRQFPLLLAGARGWKQDLRRLIERLQLADDVTTLGYVDDFQLETLYRHAHVIAMPSLYEGFGLPLLEAASFGVPALTSRAASMPEVAGDGALYVDPADVASIRDVLQTLLTDAALRETLGEKAKVNVGRFSWDRAAARTMAVLEAAAGSARG